MGWDNPPVSWRELERRLSWGTDPGDSEPSRPVTRLPATGRAGGQVPPWAELHCHSSYSFLDGASSPAELVAEAARRGLEALAITDHNGMYGVPQFAQAAAKLTDQTGITLGTIFGAELSIDPHGIERAGAPDPAGQHLLAGLIRTGTATVLGQQRRARRARRAAPSTTSATCPAHGGHRVILTGRRQRSAPRSPPTARRRRNWKAPGRRPRQRRDRADQPRPARR